MAELLTVLTTSAAEAVARACLFHQRQPLPCTKYSVNQYESYDVMMLMMPTTLMIFLYTFLFSCLFDEIKMNNMRFADAAFAVLNRDSLIDLFVTRSI